MTDAIVIQTVAGRGNIVTGTGDINVNYVLSPVDARGGRRLVVLAQRGHFASLQRRQDSPRITQQQAIAREILP